MHIGILVLVFALLCPASSFAASGGSIPKKERDEACADIQIQNKRVVFGNGQSFAPKDAGAPLRACGLKLEALSADTWARKRRNAWIWSGVGLLAWPAFFGTGACAAGASRERRALEVALADRDE